MAYVLFSGSEFHTRNARFRHPQEQRRAKAHSRQVKQALSFPRSAWECILDALRHLCWSDRDASTGDAERPICIPTQSVGTRFPEGLLNLTAMG